MFVTSGGQGHQAAGADGWRDGALGGSAARESQESDEGFRDGSGGLLRFEPPKLGAAAGVCGPPAPAAGARAAGGRSELSSWFEDLIRFFSS